MEIGDGGGCGMELPGDRGEMTDVQGGDVVMSVIWERAGMGFLEGTRASTSLERVVSLGFARVLVGRAVREPWARMEGMGVPASPCSCGGKWLPVSAWAGQYFHAWKLKSRRV